MDNKVIVKISTKQKIEKEEDVIELTTVGKYYKKSNSYYIVYEETEMSGMKGTTTTIKVEEDVVTLIRYGTTTTRMTFQKGLRDVSLYRTPYGVLELVIIPLSLSIILDDDGGEIKISYDLETAGNAPSQNELSIKIQKTKGR